ncbi:DUF3240 family protein [Methylicorpusculum oleiharenae]|uniref:DUF3240 family protein n=1 Tax=Methylicorpusculum oleiharenae TaxID=1338687 RepID=UPI0013576371|nr:DUF3240 family protein [Methylicorpusculum oleiharenae]MCD2450286.1 DUF3240 family protein [Methylicorpusculum oleiharenae]
MSKNEFMVTLSVPPSIEEAIVDCLLEIESELGFISFPVSAHDHRNEGLSPAEQVTGRQRKIRFQMYLDQAGLTALIARLKAEFKGAGIGYRVIPVIDGGVI